MKKAPKPLHHPPRWVRWYRRTDRFSQFLRQHLTQWGRWLFGGWIAAAVFGVNTRVGATYQLFVILSGLLVAAWMASRWGKLLLKTTRRLPRYGMVGQPLRYRLMIENRGARAEQNLVVFDALGMPNEKKWPARWVSYRDWRRFTTQARGANSVQQPLPTLPPKAPTDITLTVTPLRRGFLDFAATHIGKPDPLGIAQHFFLYEQPERVLILPRYYLMSPLRFQTGRKYQRGGVNLAQSIGEEDEFIGLRDYRTGDPPRRIHWRSFAKRGEPVVKEFQDEFFVRYGLLLDNFTDQPDPARFEVAVSIAASVAVAERSPEALLDLLFVGQEAYCFTAGRGVGQTEQLLEVLACVQTTGTTGMTALRALLAGHVPTLSACVCVFLTWDAEREALLQVLRVHSVETVAFVVGPTTLPPPAFVRVVTEETLATVLG